MIKQIQEWEIANEFKNKQKIYVRPFLPASVQSMFDYVKPSMRENPNHVIIHAATNDIPSDKKSESIAQDMIHLAKKNSQ